MSLSNPPLLFPFLIGVLLVGLLGALLAGWSPRSRSGRGRPVSQEDGLTREIERLLEDIHRGLKILSSPARSGGLFYLEKQEELGRMISELQSRLRFLDDGARQTFETRAGLVLERAARAGISPSPWDSPPRPGQAPRL